MGRVLIADDEPAICSFLAEALEPDGHEVLTAHDGDAAAALLERGAFDVVITDLRMPGRDGLSLLGRVRAAAPATMVILLTAHASVDSAVRAMKGGAFDYVEKPPASPAAVRVLVGRALQQRRLLVSPEVSSLGASPRQPPLGYGDPAMVAVEDVLAKVARTQTTVLLLGETGTGKEVAARALHAASSRADKPFVAINCAAISEALLESELFGHEKGAFTGANHQRRGRLELAEGGTFFLDEIGELALHLQAKLLRVLQEGQFERVGGARTLHARVRWVAATNRDLAAMIRAGSFREDLYHRLAVFPVRLPALRERPLDLLPVAEYLLAQISTDLGRPMQRLSESARRWLLGAELRGNIRELRNVLERGIILADHSPIEAEHLAPSVPDAARVSEARQPAAALPTTLSELECVAIQQALEHSAGNRKRAAARLGIGVRTLYEKLKRYELG